MTMPDPSMPDSRRADPSMPGSPAAGWYADPSGGTLLRYWDGTRWTGVTQPPPDTAGQPAAAPGFPFGAPGYPAGAPGYPTSAPGYATGAPGYPAGAPGYPAAQAPYSGPGGLPQGNRPAAGFTTRNRFFLITAAICGVYALITTFSSFAFFGILPALYTFRSFQAKEPLAVVALGITVVTIFLSFNHIYN